MSPDSELTFDRLADIRRELVENVRPHRDSVNYFASTVGFFHTAREVEVAANATDVADEVPDVGQPADPDPDPDADADPDHDADPNADADADADADGAGVPSDQDDLLDPPSVTPLVDGPPKGITTAFTCFESLNDAMLDLECSDPAGFAGLRPADRARLTQFTENALSNTDQESWRSEHSARRYCIVRALPPLISLAPQEDEVDRTKEIDLLKEVWDLVELEPTNCGVYEVAPQRECNCDPEPEAGEDAPAPEDGAEADPDPDGVVNGTPEPDPPASYPPNAFLTYWALKAVRALGLDTPKDQERRASINLWLRAVVGRELALHNIGSRVADPQQLAWAIAGIVSESKTALADQPDGTVALVEAGMNGFFAQQSDSGTWDTGRPLFHYLSAGNAYCYIYETLSELLLLALDPDQPASEEIRRLLLGHLPSLLLAREHLLATSRPLGDPKHGLVGWSSGHHPHRTSPESWATATAFRFLQGLRRLVGLEVRSRAEKLLRARRPRYGESKLAERGRTWDTGPGEVGDVLRAGFVVPIKQNNILVGTYLDPDLPRIPANAPRSTVLYGPPGTGKTTLAESVAGAIGWNFVEVTSADFLSAGSDQVSARADEIFRQLMELDQVVVLFDEVDELIRRRSGDGEMAGRFFTTTMLPRLSRLWDRGRTVFFLNTNGIRLVDPAVRRSRRFDAALLVMPPSFEAKLELLPASVAQHVDKVTITNLLEGYPGNQGMATADDARQAWFAFLRYDQAKLLDDQVKLLDDPVSADAFLGQIAAMGELELPSDWELAFGEGHDVEADVLHNPELTVVIHAYQAEHKFQRMDTSFKHRLEQAQQDAQAVPAAPLDGDAPAVPVGQAEA